MLCTCCFQAKVPYRFREKSSRYHTCVEAKKPCDSVLVASTHSVITNSIVVQKLNKQQKEWDEKEEKAGEELLALHQEFAPEAVSQLSCIQKTRKLVRERQTEAFERSMQEVDKEDDILPVLDAHERWVVKDLQF
ncbi:hypothetical protein K456DRAFT_1834071 [Colletotrichum gloeosporioides 23]|nr:hypothetical protein K456DRAFT_1834071 [Colletotrichum gloeosporioides 23]